MSVIPTHVGIQVHVSKDSSGGRDTPEDKLGKMNIKLPAQKYRFRFHLSSVLSFCHCVAISLRRPTHQAARISGASTSVMSNVTADALLMLPLYQ